MGKTIASGYISDTINGIKVNSSLKCNSGNYNNNTSRSISYVVMHYTGNTKDTAKANANYFTGSGRNASAHLFVDNTDIYQSVELRDTAWHCGASTYKHAACRNANSIGIEMCCTAGNYKISDTTKNNAAYVCAYICKLLGISASGVDTYVLRHYDVTGKNCPAQMAGAGNSEWTAFKGMVKNILEGKTTDTSSSAGTDSVSTSSTSSGGTACNYTVKILVADLNYRNAPGTSGTKVLGQLKKGYKYTVVEEKTVDGTKWGKLKSGAGWFSLNSKYSQKC